HALQVERRHVDVFRVIEPGLGAQLSAACLCRLGHVPSLKSAWGQSSAHRRTRAKGPPAPISRRLRARVNKTRYSQAVFRGATVQTSTSPPLSGMKAGKLGEPRRTARMHVVIIGAGIIGLAVAHKL